MKQPLKSTLVLMLALCSLCSFAGNPFKQSNSPDIQMLSCFLVAANGNMADGNRVVFDSRYSNAVDGNDAIKLLNPGENFGLMRNTKTLAVEARQPIAAGDTLFYDMANLRPQEYKLMIVPEYLSAAGIECELLDRYLNTRTPLSLSDTNHLTLEITSDAGSKARNRLIVVFKAVMAPLKFISVDAVHSNDNILVSWQLEPTLNMDHYIIERGTDENQLGFIFSSLPVSESDATSGYTYTDLKPLKGTNFYRIVAVDKTGKSFYSPAVKVSFSSIVASLVISPNPVTTPHIIVQFREILPGRYGLQMVNSFGQPVYTKMIMADTENFSREIDLPANTPKGSYRLILNGESSSISRQIIVQ